MSILGLILTLVVVGVVLWLINNYVPWIDPKIKTIINIVAVIFVILLLLSVFGVLGLLSTPVPRLR